MSKDVFLSISPRDTSIIENITTGIPLRVVRGSVDVKPDIKFDKTDLNNSQDFINNRSANKDSFDITVMIHYDDRIGSQRVVDVLGYYIIQGVLWYVNTRAVGIKKTYTYMITKNDNRKQERDDGYVYWDLTFTKYTPITYSQFKNTNKVVQNAIKQHDKLTGKAEAKAKNTAYTQLAKCDRLKLVYSPKKKVLKCVQYLQYVLYLNGFLTKKQINGWYDVNTKMAVKHYQQKYHKRDGLPISGNMNSATFRSLCGQIGPTIQAKSNLPKTNDFTHTKVNNDIIIG